MEFASLQQISEFQNSYIRQILPVQLLSRLGDRFLVLPTPPSSPNLCYSYENKGLKVRGNRNNGNKRMKARHYRGRIAVSLPQFRFSATTIKEH